jgi:hypothetical protein
MKRTSILTGMWAAAALLAVPYAWAGQAPGAASDPDVPVSHRDRVYTAEQFSNTVSGGKTKCGCREPHKPDG